MYSSIETYLLNLTVFSIEDRLRLHAFFGLDFKDTLLLLRRAGKVHRS